MSAPVGNQFWKLRSKHGRDKLFQSPGLLWTACCEYFEWCDNNPWFKSEQVKIPAKPIKNEKTGQTEFAPSLVHLPTARPYTMQGLCLFLNCNTGYFKDFKAGLKPSENELDKDFSTIIRTIEETVYQQKFEGAAVGAFNPSIIARDLGLTDKTDVTTAGQPLEGYKVTLNLG